MNSPGLFSLPLSQKSVTRRLDCGMLKERLDIREDVMSKLWNIQQLRSSQPESRKDMLRFGLISGLSGLVLGFAAAFLETVIDD